MSEIRIACLIAPMVDTEGPMDIIDGRVLNGPKKTMGKYGEIDVETAISMAEAHPDKVHIDILSIGSSKEVKTLQQNAIAMIQPAKLPGSLGVHALETDDIASMDAYAVAELLNGMIEKLEAKPDLILVGKDSNDYCHGIVGPYLASLLKTPYYSGVAEVDLHADYAGMKATFTEGGGKLVKDIAFPCILGTTDSLNGKDSARFTSLKGVMMAKKFKRNILSLDDVGVNANSRTSVVSIDEVTKDRKNHKIADGDGPEKVKQAMDLMINVDKALEMSGGSGSGDSSQASATWSEQGEFDGSNDIVLIVDHDGSKVRLSTHQALQGIQGIVSSTGKKVTAIVLAKDVSSLGGSLASLAVDRVVGLEDPDFEHATGYAIGSALKGLFGSNCPQWVFFVSNDLGHDSAAFLSAAYGGAFLPGLSSVDQEDGKLKGTRVVANARYMSSEASTVAGVPQIASIRATSFDPHPAGTPNAFIKLVEVQKPETQAKIVEFLEGIASTGIPLPEAKIVVSGGRGMKAKENFEQLETLAGLLGGAVGGSRAVTDLDWIPHDLQIGQTGQTVAPDIYIAVGISGAIQHLTGMNDSKYIVAINSDEEAPIHQHADLSIVDKWENVLPALIDAVKAAQ